MVAAQYPRAPTSTTKKCIDQLFTLQYGSNFTNLVVRHDSMFSPQGQVISKFIAVFAVVE